MITLRHDGINKIAYILKMKLINCTFQKPIIFRHIRKYTRIPAENPTAYLVIRPNARSSPSAARFKGERGTVEDKIDGEDGERLAEGKWREAEDFEMRDVRRDGLIEALLIAFTPPRGLLYPRVYPRSISTFPQRIRGGRIWRTRRALPSSFLSVVLRSPARPRPYLLLPHHGLHHGMPFICT